MIEINITNKEYKIKELKDILVAKDSKGVLLVSPFTDVRDIGQSIVQLEEAEDICIKRELKYQKIEATHLLWILSSFENSNGGKTMKEYFSRGLKSELYRGILFQLDLYFNPPLTDNMIESLEIIFGKEGYYIAVPESKISASIIDAGSCYPGRFLSKKLII